MDERDKESGSRFLLVGFFCSSDERGTRAGTRQHRLSCLLACLLACLPAGCLSPCLLALRACLTCSLACLSVFLLARFASLLCLLDCLLPSFLPCGSLRSSLSSCFPRSVPVCPLLIRSTAVHIITYSYKIVHQVLLLKIRLGLVWVGHAELLHSRVLGTCFYTIDT